MTEILSREELQKISDVADSLKLKEIGNKYFNEGKYEQALIVYTKAINISNEDNLNKSILFKNRAAVYLKKSLFENAVNDCSAALQINPADTKALYRRCQALQNLERFDEAYRDAKEVHNLDPKNSAIQPALGFLHAKVQDMAKLQSNTSSRVDQMFQYVFGDNIDKEKKTQAANNLIVLARERAAANVMMKKGIIPKVLGLMKAEKDPEITLACTRVIGEMCRDDASRTLLIVRMVGVPQMIEALNSKLQPQVNAAQYCIQTVLNSLSGMDLKADKKPDKQLLAENTKEIDAIIKALVQTVSSRAMSAVGRDAILELIMKNVDLNALNWAEQLLDTDAVQRLMDVASELKEYKYESSMDITDSTRTIVSVALGRIYDSLGGEVFFDKFKNQVDEFVKDKLKGMDIEAKVRVTAAMTALLQGPLDVGNYCIAQQGILEMMLVMAGTDDEVQQTVAAEALIAAASKKDKCASIVSLGMDILKKLYKSDRENIRVRALVGLCKLGSVGGTDASIRPFSDGSSQKLSLACRRFLINPAKDKDIRKWAAEGLSYLTLDGDIKEELVEDKAAMMALIELAKSGDQSVLYGVVTTLVNLTNSYDVQEIIPEMMELAKYAKQHVPEEHPKDSKECLEARIKLLTEVGVTVALVMLSKTESRNSKELICRVFNAICEYKDLRGAVVQQGGAKVLVSMALDNTDKGKVVAAQALSRIAITINPEVAFPGQRCVEVVRPFVQLLHPDRSALENFEALMALCNVAQVSETVRNRIVKENGVSMIENYMYEDHELLKRGATQCMVNMIPNDHMMELCEGDNDRVKYWTLLCTDEDYETSKAAAGGLAMMTVRSKKCCKKIFQATDWLECLRYLLSNADKDLQYRGTCIIYNMIGSQKSVAVKLIETDIMELLMALTKLDEPERAKAKEYAELSLKAAEQWKLIKPNEEKEDIDIE